MSPSNSYNTSVPSPTLADAGYSAPSEQDILSGVLDDLNNAFGGNLNQALNTPQGQLAMSMTAILGDNLSAMLGVFNGVDPSLASGKMQDAIGRIYFMERRPATATTVEVTLTTLGGGNTIPAGTILANDQAGNHYAITTDLTLPQANTAQASLTCQTLGAIECPANNLTLYQGGLGISALSNPQAGSIGREKEGRADFEKRRAQSVASNSKSTNGALLGALLNLNDVSDAYVIDNPNNTQQEIGGVSLNPHTLYCVINGGNPQDIGKAILDKKPPGIPTQGSQSVTITDDNEAYGAHKPNYIFYYDRPQIITLSISVILAPLTKQIPQNAQNIIANALIEALNSGNLRASFGDVIYASRLASIVNNLGDWAEVLSLTINGQSSLTLNIDQLPELNADNVILEIATR